MRLGKKFIIELIMLRNVLNPGMVKDGLMSDDRLGKENKLPIPAGKICRLVGSKSRIGAAWVLRTRINPNAKITAYTFILDSVQIKFLKKRCWIFVIDTRLTLTRLIGQLEAIDNPLSHVWPLNTRRKFGKFWCYSFLVPHVSNTVVFDFSCFIAGENRSQLLLLFTRLRLYLYDRQVSLLLPVALRRRLYAPVLWTWLANAAMGPRVQVISQINLLCRFPWS